MFVKIIIGLISFYIIKNIVSIILGKKMLRSYAERYIALYISFNNEISKFKNLIEEVDISLQEVDLMDFECFGNEVEIEDARMKISHNYVNQKQAIEEELFHKLKSARRTIDVISMINLEIENIVKNTPPLGLSEIDLYALKVEPSLKLVLDSRELILNKI